MMNHATLEVVKLATVQFCWVNYSGGRQKQIVWFLDIRKILEKRDGICTLFRNLHFKMCEILETFYFKHYFSLRPYRRRFIMSPIPLFCRFADCVVL